MQRTSQPTLKEASWSSSCCLSRSWICPGRGTCPSQRPVLINGHPKALLAEDQGGPTASVAHGPAPAPNRFRVDHPPPRNPGPGETQQVRAEVPARPLRDNTLPRRPRIIQGTTKTAICEKSVCEVWDRKIGGRPSIDKSKG